MPAVLDVPHQPKLISVEENLVKNEFGGAGSQLTCLWLPYAEKVGE
jgi:hypothetical protein